MSIEDAIDFKNETESCVVCGKSVEHGAGFMRLNYKGTMVNLCCPLCLETFEKDPSPHMERLTKILHHRALSTLANPSGE